MKVGQIEKAYRYEVSFDVRVHLVEVGLVNVC